MDAQYLSVDLGGTSLRMGLMDFEGNLLQLQTIPSDRVRRGEDLVRELEGLAQAMAGSHPIEGLALGIPGLVNSDEGIVYRSPHFPLWQEIRLKEALSARLPFPIVMDNDANHAALGEAWKGAGKNWPDFVLITLGTGIGGGIILNHKIFHGPLGFAGEVGHLVIDRHGMPGALGSRGTLESLASQSGLKLQVAERKKIAGLTDSLSGLNPDSSNLPEELFRVAEAGNAEAQAIWRDFGEALGCGIASVAHSLGVFKFILGGGLVGAWEQFFEPCLKEARARSYEVTAPLLEIVKCELGDRAGLVGGVRALRDT